MLVHLNPEPVRELHPSVLPDPEVRPLLVRGNGLGAWMAHHVARPRAPAGFGGRNDRGSVGSAGGGGDSEV